jgi:hypothetical protein
MVIAMSRHEPRHCREAGTLFLMRRRGLTLHCEHQHGVERWWLSDGTNIQCAVARNVIQDSNVIANGDGLFDSFSQTFSYKTEEITNASTNER